MAGGVESVNRSSDVVQSFESKFDALKKELNDVMPNGGDGKIDNDVIKALDGAFAEKLLSGTDSERTLSVLKDIVNKVKNSPVLLNGEDSVKNKQALNLLDQYLKDIQNPDKNKDDYDEFIRKLATPSKLSTMKDKEIRRAGLYLHAKRDDALKAYDMMIRADMSNVSENDRKVFENVLNEMKRVYFKDDGFMEREYGNKLESKSESLKDFLGSPDNWKGGSIDANAIKITQCSVVDKGYVAEKFNEINQRRIENNKSLIKAMNVDISNLRYDDGSLKYNDTVVDENNIVSILNIDITNLNGIDFVCSEEKSGTIDACKLDLYNGVLSRVKTLKEQNDRSSRMKLTGDVVDKEGKKIGLLNAVQTEAGEYNFIKEINGNYEFLPTMAANYLRKLNVLEGENKVNRSFYKNLSDKDGRKQTWIAAVQVLLNNDSRLLKQGESPLDVDGKFNQNIGAKDPTRERIKVFQEVHGFGKGDLNKRGFQVDGLPGPNTINELINNQVGLENLKIMESKLDETGFTIDANFADKSKYSIPENGDVYVKTGDNDNIYYKSGNNIYQISKEFPWKKSTATLKEDNVQFVLDTRPCVCEKGENVLNDLINNDTILKETGLKFSAKTSHYELYKGEVRYLLPPVNFFNKNFCGVSSMVDQIKTIYAAIQLKEDGGEIDDSKLATLRTQGLLGFDFGDQDKKQEFIQYVELLKKPIESGKSVASVVEKSGTSSQVSQVQRSEGMRTENRSRGSVGRGIPERSNAYVSPVTSQKPRQSVDQDPENVAQYGLRSVKCPNKSDLGMAGKNVYTDGRQGVYYFKEGNQIYVVGGGNPYFKFKATYSDGKFLQNYRQINLCKAGVSKLNGLFNRPGISIVSDGRQYQIKSKDVLQGINPDFFSTSFLGKTGLAEKFKVLSFAVDARQKMKDEGISRITLDAAGNLVGYKKNSITSIQLYKSKELDENLGCNISNMFTLKQSFVNIVSRL